MQAQFFMIGNMFNVKKPTVLSLVVYMHEANPNKKEHPQNTVSQSKETELCKILLQTSRVLQKWVTHNMQWYVCQPSLVH